MLWKFPLVEKTSFGKLKVLVLTEVPVATFLRFATTRVAPALEGKLSVISKEPFPAASSKTPKLIGFGPLTIS